MTAPMDVLSAIAVVLLMVLTTGAIARLLVWRDGLRARDGHHQERERY